MRNQVLSALLLLLITAGSCVNKTPEKRTLHPRIAFSRSSGNASYLRYESWILEGLNGAECINLYSLNPDAASEMLKKCDGLILTGGPDVHPAYYGRARDSAFCSIDAYRDTLEFALIRAAEKAGIPILGICRGMQILNVAYGGSLIPDIPRFKGKALIHRSESGDSCHHDIRIIQSSAHLLLDKDLLFRVNSFHHQAVEKIPVKFSITALAKDSIPEMMESVKKSDQWILAVQFHPERLPSDHPLSRKIRYYFLKEALTHLAKRQANH